MVLRTGPVIESYGHRDVNTPIAQGKPPFYWYRCAEPGCTTDIATITRSWPFCMNHWHNLSPRRKASLLEQSM